MKQSPVVLGLMATLAFAGCQEAALTATDAATALTAEHSLAAADTAAGARRGPVARILAHAAELGLTADQTERLAAIDARLQGTLAPLQEQLRTIVGERPSRDEMRELTQEERAALRTKMEQARPLMEQVRQATRSALEEARAVLTAEQQDRLRELAPERARRGPGDRAGTRARGGAPLERLLERAAELGLTDEQSARLAAIQAELEAANAPLREQLQAIVGERPGRDEMRELSDAEREALRAKMEQARPLMERMRENARAAWERAREVLTEEQRAALEERSREAGGRRPRGGPRP